MDVIMQVENNLKSLFFIYSSLNFMSVEEKSEYLMEFYNLDRNKDGKIDFQDGISVTYPTWWVNVRPSNTEPYLRMCLEADTKALMEQKRDELFAILGKPHDH